MKYLLMISLFLSSTLVFAQQPQNPAPLQPEVTLKVTIGEAETIWTALRKLPVEQVELLMAKMRQQVSEQTQKPVDKKE